jgi:hypothetical protein
MPASPHIAAPAEQKKIKIKGNIGQVQKTKKRLNI